MKVTKLNTSDVNFFRFDITKGTSFTTYKMEGEKRTYMLRTGGKAVSNPIPRKYRNKARIAFYTVKHNVERQLSRLDCRTQYYINWGRDCDGCESTRAVKFDSAYEALEFIDSSYEWADGPESWDKCTKEEYEEFQPSFRDLGMEAYENGHPHVLRP